MIGKGSADVQSCGVLGSSTSASSDLQLSLPEGCKYGMEAYTGAIHAAACAAALAGAHIAHAAACAASAAACLAAAFHGLLYICIDRSGRAGLSRFHCSCLCCLLFLLVLLVLLSGAAVPKIDFPEIAGMQGECRVERSRCSCRCFR